MNAVIVMSRAPIPNKTKTRLMPDLSGEQCSELHKSFLNDIFGLLMEIKKNDVEANINGTSSSKENLDIFLYYTPAGSEREFLGLEHLDSGEIILKAQVEGDIGIRMSEAIRNTIDKGYEKVVLIGSDIPIIQKEDIEGAFKLLDENDIVFGKTDDGGYYLVGMNEHIPEAFDIDANLWGGETVFESTLKKLSFYKKKIGFTNTRYDIDYIEDIERYMSEETRETETLKYIEKLVRENCLKIDY